MANNFIGIDANSIPQKEIHSILLTAVAPRPICFASTIDKNGNVNLSPFSFFNVFSSNPPLMIFSPARSGRDNSTKHSFDNAKEVPEVCINIVEHGIVEQMSLSSTAYPKGVNEFEKSGLTPVASVKIKPPRVAESPVSFECSVIDIIELDQAPGAGNLILSKVEYIHIREDLYTNGKIEPLDLDLVGRMGGSWYIRAKGDCLFQIPKPLASMGIGVDALPQGIRESHVLSGNDLGRLGNLEKMPSEKEIQEVGGDPGIQTLINSGSGTAEMTEALHDRAKQLIAQSKNEEALKMLLFAETLQNGNGQRDL